MKKKKDNSNVVARNKRASFDYFLSENLEVGIQLAGWEVSSIRSNMAVSIVESYVFVKDGELFISGMSIAPKTEVSTSTKTSWGSKPEATRVRKLLAHKSQIDKYIGLVERGGFTLLATKLYWSGAYLKLEIALGKGKKNHDKRQVAKENDWAREKSRLLKNA